MKEERAYLLVLVSVAAYKLFSRVPDVAEAPRADTSNQSTRLSRASEARCSGFVELGS